MAARKRGGRKTARTTAGRAKARRGDSGGSNIKRKGTKQRGATVRETGTPRELSRTATTARVRRATDVGPANPNGIAR